MVQTLSILIASILTALAVGALFLSASARLQDSPATKPWPSPRHPRALLDALTEERPLLFAFVIATLLIALMMWFAATPF